MKKVYPGGEATTDFVWDKNGMNELTQRSHGHTPVDGIGSCVVEGNGVYDYFPVYDHRGTVVKAMYHQASTGISSHFEYNAWGHPLRVENTTGLGQQLRYQTNWEWIGTYGGHDLYRTPTRLYSATLGRFLQKDPKGYVHSMCLYRYAANRPCGVVDATGGGDALVHPEVEAKLARKEEEKRRAIMFETPWGQVLAQLDTSVIPHVFGQPAPDPQNPGRYEYLPVEDQAILMEALLAAWHKYFRSRFAKPDDEINPKTVERLVLSLGGISAYATWNRKRDTVAWASLTREEQSRIMAVAREQAELRVVAAMERAYARLVDEISQRTGLAAGMQKLVHWLRQSAEQCPKERLEQKTAEIEEWLTRGVAKEAHAQEVRSVTPPSRESPALIGGWTTVGTANTALGFGLAWLEVSKRLARCQRAIEFMRFLKWGGRATGALGVIIDLRAAIRAIKNNDTPGAITSVTTAVAGGGVTALSFKAIAAKAALLGFKSAHFGPTVALVVLAAGLAHGTIQYVYAKESREAIVERNRTLCPMSLSLVHDYMDRIDMIQFWVEDAWQKAAPRPEF